MEKRKEEALITSPWSIEEGSSKSFPPHSTTLPSAPVQVPRAEHAGSGPGLQPFLGKGRGRAARGPVRSRDRCPGTHPSLEELRGGKAQPRTACL